MRKLAIAGFSFSGAVFVTVLLLPEFCWIPGGVGAALICAVLACTAGRRERRGLAVTLTCGGLAAGLLWTALYNAVVLPPVQALDGRTVRLSGTAADYPRETEYGVSLLLWAETDAPMPQTAVLYLDEQGTSVRPGDRLTTVARCAAANRTFSGEKITYYTAKGVFLQAQAYGHLEVERPERPPLRCGPALLAQRLKEGIDAAFPDHAAALVRALVTGNRDYLTDSFTTSLQRTGLSHTVAVSGMHLAFLSAMLTALLGRGKRSTAFLILASVAVFCGMAGNTPSVLRAAVMIALLQLAPLLGRERDDATALAFALALLLLANPFAAAHVGLQLSFGSVAGILLVSDPIQRWFLDRLGLEPRKESRLVYALLAAPRFLASVLSATLGASVFTIPLAAVHFQSLSLIAPLSNLLTLWAVALLFAAGLLLGGLGVFLPGAAQVLAVPWTLLARYLERVVEGLSQLPLASVSLNSFYYRAWAAFFCLLLALLLGTPGRKRLVLPLCAAGLTLCVCFGMNLWEFWSGELTAVVLDVGQGQSVLLRTGQYLTLVDCGGSGSDNAGDVAADYIQSVGRNRLDLLVVSHYHADHANGIPQLLRRVAVSAIALPDVEEDDRLRQEILELAQAREIPVWFIREETQVRMKETYPVTIFPPLGQGMETNELGLTVLVRVGTFDALLTGDMSGEVEQLLLARAELPDIELLVAGHHGSASSNTEELLERVKPELAVISVGENNRYGHPEQETLERLSRVGADIYRTDQNGTAVIRVKAG